MSEDKLIVEIREVLTEITMKITEVIQKLEDKVKELEERIESLEALEDADPTTCDPDCKCSLCGG